jgi:hypothetical protein
MSCLQTIQETNEEECMKPIKINRNARHLVCFEGVRMRLITWEVACYSLSIISSEISGSDLMDILQGFRGTANNFVTHLNFINHFINWLKTSSQVKVIPSSVRIRLGMTTTKTPIPNFSTL